MVPILNHSLFININNNITNVIIEIVIEKGLEITVILLDLTNKLEPIALGASPFTSTSEILL